MRNSQISLRGLLLLALVAPPVLAILWNYGRLIAAVMVYLAVPAILCFIPATIAIVVLVLLIRSTDQIVGPRRERD